jgi:hypothetical protein
MAVQRRTEKRMGPPTPKANTTIWRYMSVLGFLDLMNDRSVSFRQFKDLEQLDAFEGRVIEGFWESMAEMKGCDPKDARLAAEIEENRVRLDTIRCLNYASCWIMAKAENALMWKAYAPGGVAVRTTIGKFKNAKQETEDARSRLSMQAQGIVYGDNWKEVSRRFRHDGIILNRLFLHTKRRAFSAEREVRFSVWPYGFSQAFSGGWAPPDPSKCASRFSVRFKNLNWIDEIVLERSIGWAVNRLGELASENGLDLRVSGI